MVSPNPHDQPLWWYEELRWFRRPFPFLVGGLTAGWILGLVGTDARLDWLAVVVMGLTLLLAVTLHWSPIGAGSQHVRIGPRGLQVGTRFVPADDVRTVRSMPTRELRASRLRHACPALRVETPGVGGRLRPDSVVAVEIAGEEPVMLGFQSSRHERVLELLGRLPQSQRVNADSPLSQGHR